MSMSDPIADMLTRIRNAQVVQEDGRGHAFLEGQNYDSQRPERRGLH